MSLFLPKRCMVPGVIFFPILGETGYFLRVPLRNTSSGQLSHRAFPWCNRRSILTSASCKIRVMECSLLAKAWQSGDFSMRDSLKFQLSWHNFSVFITRVRRNVCPPTNWRLLYFERTITLAVKNMIREKRYYRDCFCNQDTISSKGNQI